VLSHCCCSTVVCFGGVGGISDVAGYGVHRLRTLWVSHYLGLPVSLSAFLSLSDTLTSCLDGEERGSVVIVAHGSFRIGTHCWQWFISEKKFIKIRNYGIKTNLGPKRCLHCLGPHCIRSCWCGQVGVSMGAVVAGVDGVAMVGRGRGGGGGGDINGGEYW
jgi:hypothetical protein